MKKMMLILVTLVIGMWIGVMAGPNLKMAEPASDPMVVSNAGPTLEAVRSLASLVTTRVTVSDVQLTELQGYTGGAKAALLVRGDFTLGTNLAVARFIDVDVVERSATVILEQPMAENPRVDLSRTRLVLVTTQGLWDVVPGHTTETVVTDDAYRQAQQMILQVSLQPGWRNQARAQAEKVLSTFFTSVHWTVSVRWEGDPDAVTARLP